MKKVAAVLSAPFLLVPILLFVWKKELLMDDLLRYRKEVPFTKVGAFYLCYVLLGKKEYRSVFVYRLGLSNWARVVLPFTPPLDGIEILTKKCGGGLRLFHKSGCTINAQSIGCNFSCGQGVTIGIGKEKNGINRPVIGNNCWVGANAVIIGGIVIGNDVTIGAGSVVVKDVPDGSTVVGNPGRNIHQL